jgi:hypothetical protein
VTADPGERERIRAAVDRTLAGAPERSNEALTVVALAIEAGVPRNALTQRHTDLKNEFYVRIKGVGGHNEDKARLRATIARLKQTIANKNRELAELTAPTSPLSSAPSTSSPWKTGSSATGSRAAASSHSPAVTEPAPD